MQKSKPLYAKVYDLLRTRILAGIYKKGYNIPSHQVLCEEFQVSDITIRKVLKMLEDDGFIETVQGRKAKVIYNKTNMNLVPLNSNHILDSLKSLKVLFSPFILYSIENCLTKEDYSQLCDCVNSMFLDEEKVYDFWVRLNYFWSSILHSVQNTCLNRIIEYTKYTDLFYIQGCSYELRLKELCNLKELLQSISSHCFTPDKIQFPMLYSCANHLKQGHTYYTLKNSSLLMPANEIALYLRYTVPVYQLIYIDTILQIEKGDYLKGDFLPTYEQMKKKYDVSISTIQQTVKKLRETGVIYSDKWSHLQIAVTAEQVIKLQAANGELAKRLKFYAETIQIVTFTIEETAALAVKSVSPQKIFELSEHLTLKFEQKSIDYWGLYKTLLEFITEYIPFHLLKQIYSIILKDYAHGKGIASYIRTNKSAYFNFEKLHNCIKALKQSDLEQFAKEIKKISQAVYEIAVYNYENINHWLK